MSYYLRPRVSKSMIYSHFYLLSITVNSLPMSDLDRQYYIQTAILSGFCLCCLKFFLSLERLSTSPHVHVAYRSTRLLHQQQQQWWQQRLHDELAAVFLFSASSLRDSPLLGGQNLNVI